MAYVVYKRGTWFARVKGDKAPGKWSSLSTEYKLETDKEAAQAFADEAQRVIDERNAPRVAIVSLPIEEHMRLTTGQSANPIRPTQGSDLYVLFCVHTRRCKIGRANDVWQRLGMIQSCSPTPLILWCSAKDLGPREWGLHLRYEQHRLHGEWFGPSVTAEIAAAVRFGDEQALAAFVQRRRT